MTKPTLNTLFFLTCIPLFCCSMAWAQTATPRLVHVLPAPLSEASGIEFNGYANIWIHNDSGDSANVYQIDTLGNLLRTIKITNTTAIDFEDITKDNNGNYYIADAGNNLCTRTDLHILKFKNPDSIAGNITTAEKISFTYPDQHLFPPPSESQNFDCEAMMHRNDSLWLFSKNHGTSKFCKLYKIPDKAGSYTAALTDSLDLGEWVTAGAISPDGKSAVLLSYASLWLFTNFSTHTIFDGTATRISIPFTQKEGVVFTNDSTILIVDEKETFTATGQNLYILNLASWINGLANEQQPITLQLYPNPVNQSILHITINTYLQQKTGLTITDISGKIIYEKTETVLPGYNKLSIELEKLQPGFYFLSATQAMATKMVKFVVNK